MKPKILKLKTEDILILKIWESTGRLEYSDCEFAIVPLAAAVGLLQKYTALAKKLARDKNFAAVCINNFMPDFVSGDMLEAACPGVSLSEELANANIHRHCPISLGEGTLMGTCELRANRGGIRWYASPSDNPGIEVYTAEIDLADLKRIVG